jgi:hypothetical protein
VPERALSPDVSPGRARLIHEVGKKWANGTKLRYSFFQSGDWSTSEVEKTRVREGFRIWQGPGIGITFEEVATMSEAEIRIGFLRGDGSWSYIGRDVYDLPKQGERTMNFGWDLMADPRGVDVPVHEIGHTLGFPHEHQNPFAGIVWDEQAVYAYFEGPPNNWDRDTVFNNILRKLPQTEVIGSSWDPDSIMEYEFAGNLIIKPEKYHGGLNPAGGLSPIDKKRALEFYPPLGPPSSYPALQPFRSEILTLAPKQQANFTIEPPATRDYTIQTFGGSDNVAVLFEDQGGDLKFMDGDDDSGTDRNVTIKVRLIQGRHYVLRIRHYVNYSGLDTAVMIW